MNASGHPWLRAALIRSGQVAITLVLFALFNAVGGWFEVGNGVSILYPATAVSIVTCMTFGAWAAIGVVLGTILTPWRADTGLSTLLLSGMVIAMQGVIPWLVFRLRPRLSRNLSDLRSLIAFLIWGTIVNTALTAIAGNILVIEHPPGVLLVWREVFVWWIADFVAALVLATPVLAFGGALLDRTHEGQPRTITNALQIVAIVVILGIVASIAIRTFLLSQLENDRMEQHQAWTAAQHELNQLHGNLMHAAFISPSSPNASAELEYARFRNESLLGDLGELVNASTPELQKAFPLVAASARQWFVLAGERLAGSAPAGHDANLADNAQAVLALHEMIDDANAREWNAYVAARRKIVTVTTLVDGAVFLTVVFAGITLFYTISRPFRQLRSALAAMRSGAPFDAARIDSRYAEFRSVAQTLEETSAALRRREEELRTQTEKALEASRHKSDFLAKMSHELRTPLNSIIGFADLLVEQEETISPRKRLGFLGIVSNSAGHLLTLINDLLDIAKVESGKLQLEFDTFDLRMSIANTVSSTLPLFHRKNQTVDVVNFSEPMMVRADPSRIEQVFLNLLSNANKFTGEGKRITVRGNTDGPMWCVEVIDEGIGIRTEDAERIFEDFEQAGPGRSGSGGTGLGLALVQRLVRAHGGEVELESAPGDGATFRIRLPRA